MDATQLKGPSINPSAVAEVAWKSKIFDRLALEALVRLLLLLVKKLSRLSSRFWSPAVGRDPFKTALLPRRLFLTTTNSLGSWFSFSPAISPITVLDIDATLLATLALLIPVVTVLVLTLTWLLVLVMVLGVGALEET